MPGHPNTVSGAVVQNVATACAPDATDQVWAFDVTTKTWDAAAFAAAPERPGPGCVEDVSTVQSSKGRGRHAAVVVDGATLRVSGGFRSDGASQPSQFSLDAQWSLDLKAKSWTLLGSAEGAAAAASSALTRSDHALVVLGKDLVIMAGGNCRSPDPCNAAYALTQASGGDGVTLDDPISLAIGPSDADFPTGSRLISNKAVVVGAHLYSFALGNPAPAGAGSKAGSVWRYKIASHVAQGNAGTDDKDVAEYGSKAKPYKTLSYAVNRGGAPVVVLMTGNHRGDGNADAMLAGAVTGGADNAVCSTAITSLLTPTVAETTRETCVGPLVVTGEKDAVLKGEDTKPGATVTGAVSLLLHGFTITGGAGKFGGALYLDALRWTPATHSGAHLVVQGMMLSDSAAEYSGGCMYAARLASIYNSTISGCKAVFSGGAIYATAFSETMPLDNVVMRGGATQAYNQLFGGLIHANSVKLKITGSALSGGYANKGGGVYITGIGSAPSHFVNSTLADCTATKLGGGGGLLRG